MNRLFPIDDPSRVAEVRRAAAKIAREEGLEEARCANAEVVATEIATNLVKHAKLGEIYLDSLSDTGRAGVEILSIDRGPGMSSVDQCIRDGFSSTGSPGTGLGAMLRLSDEFDAHSIPENGTVLVSRVYRSPETPPCGAWIGSLCVPIRGEEISGDSWGIHLDASSATLILADGLGHGIMAAEASKEAVLAFRALPSFNPAAAIDQVHRQLRGTRGAAVAIARIDFAQSKVQYAGIGNISGVIGGGARVQSMVSHNGTAGHEARRVQEFSYNLPAQWALIMHSDGIHTNWNLDHYPGLIGLHPSVICGVLYRDASRSRDDVCVVVIKNRSEQ
jgi:anti-sigma regulatory factor (Ser/Thr protein kinase)